MLLFLTVLIGLTGAVISQGTCPEDWFQYGQTCLYAELTYVIRDEAISNCQNVAASGTLASAATRTKFDFIINNLIPHQYENINFWLGLYTDNPSNSGDVAERKQGWLWQDGTTYTVPDSSWGWNDWGEPQEEERYVRMRNNRWLATKNASEQNFYICQFELLTTTSTTTETTSPTTTTTSTTTTSTTTTATTPMTSTSTTMSTTTTTTTTPSTTTETTTSPSTTTPLPTTTESTTTITTTTTTTTPSPTMTETTTSTTTETTTSPTTSSTTTETTTASTTAETTSSTTTETTTSFTTTTTTTPSPPTTETTASSTTLLSSPQTTPTTSESKSTNEVTAPTTAARTPTSKPTATTTTGSLAPTSTQQTTDPSSTTKTFNITYFNAEDDDKPDPKNVIIAVVVSVVGVLVVVIVIFVCLKRRNPDGTTATLRSNKSYAISQPQPVDYLYDEVDEAATFSNGSLKRKQRAGSNRSTVSGDHRVSYNNNDGDIQNNQRESRTSKLSDRVSWMMDKISATTIKEEFEKLNQKITTFGRRRNVYRKATARENYGKNRSPDVIPLAPRRVVLKTEVPERNDYINAVFVDGYERSNAIIATIAPLSDTVSDFWRAVYDYDCPAVIMLCPHHHLKLNEVYFPEMMGGDPCTYKPFEITVKCNTFEKEQGVEIRDLALTYAHRVQRVRHFSVSCDLDTLNQREKIKFFIHLYEAVKKWQLSVNDTMSPILVHCLDGVQWTGVFCALFVAFDKINATGTQNLDLTELIQTQRLCRPQFISNQDQYRLVLETLTVFATTNDPGKASVVAETA